MYIMDFWTNFESDLNDAWSVVKTFCFNTWQLFYQDIADQIGETATNFVLLAVLILIVLLLLNKFINR